MPLDCGIFLFRGDWVDLFIYSDESGVFDKVHNEYFVFGWILFLGKNEKDIASRKYLAAESSLRGKYKTELKATLIDNKDKSNLFRSLNAYQKGAVVIDQKKILNTCFGDKKTKQRYLDFAFKMGIKYHICSLINKGIINPNEIENMYFFVDEHSTATNGLYELEEALLQEFKCGTHNWNYQTFFPPIFPQMKSLTLRYKDSKKSTLVRSADIIANRVYFHSVNNSLNDISEKVFIRQLP